MSMVNVTIENDALKVDVQGMDRLWTLHGHLDIPLTHVRGIRQDPVETNRWWRGFRIVGVRLPGTKKAGTFIKDGKRVFFDVDNPDNAIIVDLTDDRYSQLVVEVADPAEMITRVETALDHRTLR